jgi:hypothetical protein
MGLVVAGLSPSGDTAALRAALVQAGLSLEFMQVISPDDSAEPVARGIVGAEILTTTDPGLGVPGINNGGHQVRFFRNESLEDRLDDLEIPDSEVDNYIEALERGTTVVAYFAKPDSLDKVVEIFKGSSIANVRTY